jgi:hypothetical protein
MSGYMLGYSWWALGDRIINNINVYLFSVQGLGFCISNKLTLGRNMLGYMSNNKNVVTPFQFKVELWNFDSFVNDLPQYTLLTPLTAFADCRSGLNILTDASKLVALPGFSLTALCNLL